MRKSYIVKTLTSVDIQKVFKMRGKVIEIFEGVIYRENFQISPFRKIIDKLVAERRKYKEKNNDVMQLFLTSLMSSLYRRIIGKDIEEGIACKSEF